MGIALVGLLISLLLVKISLSHLPIGQWFFDLKENMPTIKERYEETLRARKEQVFSRALENAVGKYTGSDAGILSNEKMSLLAAVLDISSELGFEFSALILVPVAEIHRTITDEWIAELRLMISELTHDEKMEILAKISDEE